MTQDGQSKALRTCFDAVMKSDARMFASVLEDFQHLESVTFWSDVINL